MYIHRKDDGSGSYHFRTESGAATDNVLDAFFHAEYPEVGAGESWEVVFVEPPAVAERMLEELRVLKSKLRSFLPKVLDYCFDGEYGERSCPEPSGCPWANVHKLVSDIRREVG